MGTGMNSEEVAEGTGIRGEGASGSSQTAIASSTEVA